MTISINELTTNEIEGLGVFDELMRSVKAHLLEEQGNGRITDVNYSSVYLGALQSTRQMSVKFLLDADKVSAETRLTEEHILNAQKEGKILDLQEQKLAIDIYNAKYEECLLKTKIAQVEADTKRSLQETANAKTQASLIIKQISKADAEVRLYLQKATTEKAQTVDKIDGVTIKGVVGKQNEMYRNQSNGYLRLAEQTQARLLLDAFAVLQSNGGLENIGGELTDWGVTPAAVTKAVEQLTAGITNQANDHAIKDPSETTGNISLVPYVESDPEEPSAPASCPVSVPPV